MIRVLVTFLLALSSSQIFSYESSIIKEEAENLPEEERGAILSEMFSDLSDEEREFAIALVSLDWKETGTYKLKKSNSMLSLPEGYKLLIGEEAKKGIRLLCSDPDNPDLEAAVMDVDLENVIHFENFRSGHIFIDDWEDLDPKSLIKSISENTEKSNKDRRKNGGGDLHVIGWTQEPILDKHTNTVYWAIEVESANSGAIVNSVAIRLGREGFEKLTWVTQKTSYVPFGGHLDVMLRSHSFDPGYGYNDYKTGDKIASYGIATLVAATVGGKIVKAGGLAVILKKLGGFIFAGIAVLFYKFKNTFKRKED